MNLDSLGISQHKGDSMLVDVDIGKRQVYVKGRRLHHGLVGAIAILAGIVLAVHDRKDFPWSIHD